jgi:hypothetical protein
MYNETHLSSTFSSSPMLRCPGILAVVILGEVALPSFGDEMRRRASNRVTDSDILSNRCNKA